MGGALCFLGTWAWILGGGGGKSVGVTGHFRAVTTGPMKSLSDVRSGFLQFFAERGHTVVSSSPLVPPHEPPLLFTNAGMVQFKNLFTGAEKRPYSRATTVQKCVRAGGKHNDLDNVGYTARHHTFFEMLGNFSFGDYFKEEAITFAWDFVTKVIGLPKDKLLVTVYNTDDQARQLWKKIAGFSDDKIIGHESNLWAMGPTGPCGYCSEIFFDQGDGVFGGPPASPDEDGDRFLEFWNLVFMQFEQVDENTRLDLPKPSIDTGMGLERIAAILQGVTNNYDVDLFRHLIAASESASGVDSKGEATFSHRIIADHLRKASIDTGMGLERMAAILQGVTNNYDVDLFRHLIAASESASGVDSKGEATFSH